MNQPPDSSGASVRYKAVDALVASYTQAGAASLEHAFPAALVAPVWRALLEADAISLPDEIDPARVEVRMPAADRIEIVIERSDGDPTVVSVHVWGFGSNGLKEDVGAAARGLADALDQALRGCTTEYELAPETGQKMHG